jgi:hypothetical protein
MWETTFHTHIEQEAKLQLCVSWLLRSKNCYAKRTWGISTFCVSTEFPNSRVLTIRGKKEGTDLVHGEADDKTEWDCDSGLSRLPTYQCLFQIVWTVSLYKCTYFLLPSIDFLIACCFVYETNPSRAAMPDKDFCLSSYWQSVSQHAT